MIWDFQISLFVIQHAGWEGDVPGSSTVPISDTLIVCPTLYLCITKRRSTFW